MLLLIEFGHLMRFSIYSCVEPASDSLSKDNMLKSYQLSQRNSQTVRPLLLFKIAKLVGLKHIGNLYLYLLVVKFPSGMSQRFVLLAPDSKPLVGVLVARGRLKISLDLLLILLRKVQAANSLPLSVTISYVKLQKLSWWEVCADPHLFLSAISLMRECGMPNLEHGGMKIRSVLLPTIPLSTKKSQTLVSLWKNGCLYIRARVANVASLIAKPARKP